MVLSKGKKQKKLKTKNKQTKKKKLFKKILHSCRLTEAGFLEDHELCTAGFKSFVLKFSSVFS